MLTMAVKIHTDISLYLFLRIAGVGFISFSVYILSFQFASDLVSLPDS